MQSEHKAETLEEAVARHRRAAIALDHKRTLHADRREKPRKVIEPISEAEWALDQLGELMSQKRFPIVQESQDIWDHAQYVGLEGLTVDPYDIEEEPNDDDEDFAFRLADIEQWYVSVNGRIGKYIGTRLNGESMNGCICEQEVINVDF